SLIKLFIKTGWIFRNNSMEYLPPNDRGMFNWQSEELSYEKLFSVILQKQQTSELIGVCLYRENTDIGITLLAESAEKISLLLNINRKTIARDFTDISWYIANTAAELEQNGCVVENLEYCEYLG
ncbi:MAG: hypothetical protein ACI4Q4_03595, partial [Oscillospiraceae bacterium]